jgi:hypothetical protein
MDRSNMRIDVFGKNGRIDTEAEKGHDCQAKCGDF